MRKQRISILGATGSIGVSTLDVIKRHPDKFIVESLTANNNVDKLFEQICEFTPSQVVVVCSSAAEILQKKIIRAGLETEVHSGKDALCRIVSLDSVDTVVAAIVGASGLLPTFSAVEAGKKVLLANKEALVTSGQIFIDAMQKSGAQLLPIDSEHNAIFQALPYNEQSAIGHCQLAQSGINKILLTGSGGPFRTIDTNRLSEMTPEQACKHPNWDMGQKISVDSATMMNKGLEFIEAKWLFNVDAEDIQVVLHPQSTIHSMVQYIDGSVIAQMGNPDMRTPIAHALAYPERIEAGVDAFDFFNTLAFEFEKPDFSKYPNLKLAIDACKKGQAACTALNAANEVAVDAFLNKKIKFTDIYKINETSMKKFVSYEVLSIDDVLELDQQARLFTQSLLDK